ncbi:hypothetical protein [Alkalicoccobacillus porphyridii]|uniref:Uncharacterized protein n=1 Tax=Alkalicoccobacillus porphyridii TaxID=2597270 RepID=A0A553ZXF9_9BACI|nr:hypothetical protein [Alkalicoccobacillus porphyridii]TSB46124.1 hypothetical protein FN960_12220 [Alkalicoccobacillus porphyridii]
MISKQLKITVFTSTLLLTNAMRIIGEVICSTATLKMSGQFDQNKITLVERIVPGASYEP